jgi:hypothetical protein
VCVCVCKCVNVCACTLATSYTRDTGHGLEFGTVLIIMGSQDVDLSSTRNPETCSSLRLCLRF